MMIPNFLIIGAQKAGTTSLITHLSKHPDVFVPKDKEICCYYDNDGYNKRFESYPFKHYFRNWNGQKYSGNAPVNLLYFAKSSAKIIFDTNPATKIIALLRNPIDRGYSAYWYFIRCGLESFSFEDALTREGRILKNGNFQELSDFTYVSHGYYHDQLTSYLEWFERKQILILFYENLCRNPIEMLKEVYDFLEIKHHPHGESLHKKYNARSKVRFQFINNFIFKDHKIKKRYKQIIPGALRAKIHDRIVTKILDKNRTPFEPVPMKPETRAHLKTLFDRPNKQLEALLNMELTGWK